MDDYIHYMLGRCTMCNQELPAVDVPVQGDRLWARGMDIKQACPTIPADLCYVLTNHVCPRCQRAHNIQV